jgi:hypothetical protein
MSELVTLTKSQMLRASLRCHALGWLALIPVVGLLPAMLAFAQFRSVVLGKGNRWNAARGYLLLGVWLATAGMLLSLAVAAVTVLVVLDAYW